MVSTLPSKPPKGVAASAPISSAAIFSEPDEMKQPELSVPETHIRNHQRSHTGSAVYTHEHSEDSKMMNRVLMVLMRRLGSSKTFGENVIFMLNRAGRSGY